MLPPELVPWTLAASLDETIGAVSYSLAHGRDAWSSDYIEHLENSLARLEEMRVALAGLRETDRQVQQREIDHQLTRREKEKLWVNY